MKGVAAKRLKALAVFLERNSDMTLPRLHGFLSAVASSPSVIKPASWFRHLEINDSTNLQEAQTAAQIALDMYSDINEAFAIGDFTPLLNETNCPYPSFHTEAVAAWVGGYLFAVDYVCDHWNTIDKDIASELLAPLLALTLTGEQLLTLLDDANDFSRHATKIKDDYARELPKIIRYIYRFFTYEMREQKNAEVVSFCKHKMSKNNSLCPCNSRLKYKDCCGLHGQDKP